MHLFIIQYKYFQYNLSLLLFYLIFKFSPQYFFHARINSLIIGMIICDLHNKNIWANVSNLKGKYNQFLFKCFEFSNFKVSCLNTYHIAVMCFPTVCKVSVVSKTLHVASSSNCFLASLAFKLLSSKMALC